MRYTTIFLLLLLSLTISFSGNAQTRSAKPTATLRVMTFNIRYANPKDSLNFWDLRKDKVAGLIRYHKADLLGVQEALVSQLKDMEKAMPEFAWYGVGRDDAKEKGEFSAIFYRKDRFKLLDKGTFWLSENPQQVGSKSWDAAITRVCTWVKFQDLQTNKTFYHFNTHYDHLGKIAREKSSVLLVKQAQTIAGKFPVLITGDFNVDQKTEAYKTMIANTGFQDAQFVSETPHYGPNGSFNGFSLLKPLQPKIDFIFVKAPVRVLQHAVLTDQQDGRYPSDHLPVIAEVEIR